MRRLTRLFATALVATTLLVWAGKTTWQAEDQPETQRAISAKTLSDLPLVFVPNEGQSHPSVRNQVHAWQGGTLFFEDAGLTLAIPDGPAMVDDGGPSKIGLPQMEPALQGSVTAIGLSFVGGRTTTALPQAQDRRGRSA